MKIEEKETATIATAIAAYGPLAIRGANRRGPYLRSRLKAGPSGAAPGAVAAGASGGRTGGASAGARGGRRPPRGAPPAAFAFFRRTRAPQRRLRRATRPAPRRTSPPPPHRTT